MPEDLRKTTCYECEDQKNPCQNARSKLKELKMRAAEVPAEKIMAGTEADPSADIESIRVDILALRAMQISLLQNQTSTVENLGDVRNRLRIVRYELRDLMAYVGKLATLVSQLAPPENLATYT